MNKRQFIENLNQSNMGGEIYEEIASILGKFNLLWRIGKERSIGKYIKEKTLCYQCPIPNKQGEFDTFDLVVRQTVRGEQSNYQVMGITIY